MYVQITSCFQGDVKEPQTWTNLIKQNHAQVNNINKIQYNTTRCEISPLFNNKNNKNTDLGFWFLFLSLNEF